MTFLFHLLRPPGQLKAFIGRMALIYSECWTRTVINMWFAGVSDAGAPMYAITAHHTACYCKTVPRLTVVHEQAYDELRGVFVCETGA